MTFSFFLILFSSFGKHLSLLNSVFGYLCHILRCLLKHFAEMKSFGHTLFWHLNFIVRILFVFLILSSLHSVFLKLIANITCFFFCFIIWCSCCSFFLTLLQTYMITSFLCFPHQYQRDVKWKVGIPGYKTAESVIVYFLKLKRNPNSFLERFLN